MDTKQHNQPKQPLSSNHKLVEIYASPQTISSQNKILHHDKIGLGVNAEKTGLKQIIDQIHVGVAILDMNHVIVEANKLYLKWLPNDEIGKLSQQCYHCDKVDRMTICISCPISFDATTDEHCGLFDFSINNNRHNFKVVGNPIYGNNNKVIGIVQVIEEVTEQVNAETALQLALQFVDTTKELMWYYDTNYRYLAANQAYCDTFQCEINDIMGKHCVEVITEETFNAIKSSLDKCLQGKEVHREFWKTFPAYDYPRYVEVVYMPCIGDNGDIIGVVGRMHDITVRKIAQEALQKRLDVEKLIATISTDFINLPYKTIDVKINQAIEQVALFENIDRGYIFLFDKEHEAWDNKYQWIQPAHLTDKNDQYGISIKKHQYFSDFILAREIFNCASVQALPNEANGFKNMLLKQGVQSIICVPMMLEGHVVGFLRLDSIVGEVEWSEQTETFLKVIANIFSNTIGRKKHFDEREIYKKKLRTLAIQLSNAEEKERRSLAEKLHDSIGQLLAASRLKVNFLNQEPGIHGEKIMEIDHLLEQTIQQTRDLTFNLCPP